MPKPQIDGILNIDKPYGITSMDIVRRIKRASGQKRVGHGGTLDPVATGVVTICFGQATRMMEHLVDGKKEYRTEIELGVSTDTYDSLGEAVDKQDASHVTLDDVERVLETFKGSIKQVPPMYSALKRQGKRLYELARAGIEVEREPRDVEVHWIKLLNWSPPIIAVEVGCGRGFYMRSFAHDVGQALGCGGHLKSLVRLRSGVFNISNAVALADMEERFADDTWEDSLYAPDVALYRMGAAIVSRQLENIIKHGQPLPPSARIPHSQGEDECRVYGVDGKFIAILKFDTLSKQWQPGKVFSFTYLDEE